MSVPAPGGRRHVSGRWETIRYAIGSNARTIRLCVICLVSGPAAGTIIALIIRHVLWP